MKTCPNCGAQVDDYASVCQRCGYAQNSAQYQSQQYQQPQYPNYQQPQYQQPQYQNYQQPQYQQYPANVYQNNPYQGNPYGNQYRSARPAIQLTTDRSLLIFILLNLVTLGIYSLVVFCKMSDEINITASHHDGRKTMNFALAFLLLGPITGGIYTLVWFHGFSERVGDELRRRRINYSFGAADFWLWDILGLLIFVGPYIYRYKLFEAMNLINSDYNRRG